MGDRFGSGKSSNKATTDLHAGLSRRIPKATDASTRPPKGAKSVNDDTTRSSVAPTPRSLSGRCA